MSDAHDEFSLLAHLVYELHGDQVGVVGGRELARGLVERPAEAVALERTGFGEFTSQSKDAHDGEQPGGERRDQVLAGAGADDGVVRARHRRPMVGRHHQTHFYELARILRHPATATVTSSLGEP